MSSPKMSFLRSFMLDTLGEKRIPSASRAIPQRERHIQYMCIKKRNGEHLVPCPLKEVPPGEWSVPCFSNGASCGEQPTPHASGRIPRGERAVPQGECFASSKERDQTTPPRGIPHSFDRTPHVGRDVPWRECGRQRGRCPVARPLQEAGAILPMPAVPSWSA